MARYIGGSLAVAAVATVFNAVTDNHLHAGRLGRQTRSRPASRAPHCCWRSSPRPGVALALLIARHRPEQPQAIDLAAAAAATSHTIPTQPIQPLHDPFAERR